MEVVYLFCEPAFTRIPVYDHDPRLLRLFSGRGGTWNSAGREFIFSRNIRAEEFTGILKGIPWVWVEKNAPLPAGRGGRLRIYNFRDRLWEETAGFASDVFFGRWLLQLEAELRSRKYSPRTLRAYVYYNRLICNTLKKTPEEIRPEDVKVFLAGIEKNRDYSSSSINLAISAIKFFYKNVVKNETMKEQHRPHHDKRLPVILDKAEISSILNLEKNPKHRLLLMLTYSSGLRVSEVVALKREHIDLARGVIYVRLGKGRKDRCTLLSEKAARYITEYFSLNEISTWLFPGQPPDRPLSIRAAQLIFDKAVRRAEIRKKISIHCLRHTFATHLLEGGTDIRYIQTLLGHANLRTTERYTHVARRSVLHIQSPLDTIL